MERLLKNMALRNKRSGTRFKKIIGHDDFFISECGQIINTRTWREVVQRSDKDGYMIADIDGRTIKVHRIVYESFVGKLVDGMVINHKDEIKHSNHYANLEQVTVKYNVNYGDARHKHLQSMVKNKKTVPVRQIKNGKIIKEYESTNAAATETGIPQSNIFSVIKGIYKKDGKGNKYMPRTAGGFIWEKIQ